MTNFASLDTNHVKAVYIDCVGYILTKNGTEMAV